MPSNILRYAGYLAEFAYDDSADAFCGRILAIRDVIDFYGRSVEELRSAFRDSVDAYVAWCEE
ncbi:MAG TPA: hypothetical protein VJY39_00600 [Acidisphaera sp.]|nr:hypothetical protein [Acidisphaera sp.]